VFEENDMHLTIRRSLLLIVFTALLGGVQVFGQQVLVVGQEAFEGKQGANRTRGELYMLLQKYPPRLGEVLRLDHSLLSNENYLQPYSDLRQFLQQHPEVLRDPDFYVGNSSEETAQLRRNLEEAYRRNDSPLEEVLNTLVPLSIFFAVIAVLIWIVRSVVDHRRWLRVWRAQSEAHSKLLDRMTSNEDMLAYLQTPAGKRFFESSAMPVDFPPVRTNLPAGRILWSVQVGLLLLLGGISIQFVRMEGLQPGELGALNLLSVLGIGLGISFILGAAASYMISAKLGLLEEPARRPPSNIEPPAST
jgi:hypothetical protein